MSPGRKHKTVAIKLLNAARTAHAELFALMLAEKAQRLHGRYSDAYERLDRAIKDTEAALKVDET